MRINLGLGSILFIVFLILKLTKVITWSWLWVCAPIWIPLLLAGVIFVGAIAVAIIVKLLFD